MLEYSLHQVALFYILLLVPSPSILHMDGVRRNESFQEKATKTID